MFKKYFRKSREEYRDCLKIHCRRKILTAEKAVSKIKRGSRVFIGTGCGEPQHLIRAMVADSTLQDIMVYQMLSYTFSEFVDDPSFHRRFSLKLFFISPSMRKAAFEGKIDYIPAYLSQISRLFSSRQIGLDVALIQVTPPDAFGYCSLGVSVDITPSAVAHARMVIAQVNPRMPRTWGDSIVHVDDIDYVVPYEEALVNPLPRTIQAKDTELAARIGLYVSQLIDDGATLQVGFGYLPNLILQQLETKKDIGIHTQVITEGFLPLFEKKVITNRKKNLLPGRAVTSLCMGSEKLYAFVHKNPLFLFRSSEYVNDPSVIALNDNMVSLSSALEVDLTGQVSSDSQGYLFYSGIGDQVDFLRGCAMSKGGFSIIAMPSTAQDGAVSRIVSHLSEGAGVATTRGDVNFVVTEYGIAELQGKSIYQRVMELAQIAHPKFRKDLIDVAKKRHYIFADQIPPSQEDLLFLEAYKSNLKLDNGKDIMFRPLLPSDEFAYRNFFYSLREDTIYLRFFRRVKLFSHEVVQRQWAVVDYRKNMSLIGLVQQSGHKEIIAVGSYATVEEDRAEVAFVVREDFQGKQIASYLLENLENIALKNNFTSFCARVLKENTAMVRIFQKRYPNAVITADKEGNFDIVMMFTDAVPLNRQSRKREGGGGCIS